MKRLSTLTSIFAIAMLFCACFDENIAVYSTYRIALYDDRAPFSTKVNNGITGIDAEILEAIAREGGFRYEAVAVSTNECLAMIDDNLVDAAMSCIMSQQLKNNLDYSNPFHECATVLITLDANNDIFSQYDLNGKRLAVVSNTGIERYVQEQIEELQIEALITYSNNEEALQSVITGFCDACAIERDIFHYFQQSHPLHNLKDVGHAFNLSSHAMATKKGEQPELMERFNYGLKVISENGTLDKILARYFNHHKQEENRYTILLHRDNYYPLTYIDGNNIHQGIERDILEAIALIENVQFDYKETSYSNVMPMILSEQADAAMASITFTQKRDEICDFSQPYFESVSCFVTHQDNQDITKEADLYGKVFSVAKGSIVEEYLVKRKYSLCPSKIIYCTQLSDPVTQVVQKNADVALANLDYIQARIAQGDPIKIVCNLNKDAAGLIVKQDTHQKLIKLFNHGLATIKANGTYDAICKKHSNTKLY